MSKIIKNLITIFIIIISILFVFNCTVYNAANYYIIANDIMTNNVIGKFLIVESHNMIKENNAYFCDILGGDITIIAEENMSFKLLSIEDIIIDNGAGVAIPLTANFLYYISYIDNHLIIDNIQYKYNFEKIKIVFENYGALGEVENYKYNTFHNENFPISSDINIVKGDIANKNGIKELIPNKLISFENRISNYIAIKDSYKLYYISLINYYQKDVSTNINEEFLSLNMKYDSIVVLDPNGEYINVTGNKILFNLNGIHKISLVNKYCITNIIANVCIPEVVVPEIPDITPPDEIETYPDHEFPVENNIPEIIGRIIFAYIIIVMMILSFSLLLFIILLPQIVIQSNKKHEIREINNIKNILNDNNRICFTYVKRHKLRVYSYGVGIIACMLVEIIFPFLFPLNAIVWAKYNVNVIEKMSGQKPNTKTTKNKRIIACSIVYKMMIILGTLLFIVPGILVRINFGLYGNIVVDNEDSNDRIVEIFAKAMKLMRGYKLAYFRLLCKQLFYVIISILSLGILLPWTLPYIISQKSLFYLTIYT